MQAITVIAGRFQATKRVAAFFLSPALPRLSDPGARRAFRPPPGIAPRASGL